MKKEDRDIFDDLVRSKLQHFEAETTLDDWEAIISRLPQSKAIPLRRRWPYWAAAAIVSLIAGTGLYFFPDQPIDLTIAEQIERETQILESRIKEEKKGVITPIIVADKTEPVKVAIAKRPVVFSPVFESETEIKPVPESGVATEPADEYDIPEQPETARKQEGPFVYTGMPEQQMPDMKKNKQKASRKWTFGAGTGSFTESTGGVVNTYALRSSTNIDDEKLLELNAVADMDKEKKTNIKHKTPISFGLSASKQLNNRLSLQTGLTYTMLTSDWETEGTYNNKTRQRLHFIGLPLSLTYRIAEWNRFNLYASAGAQTEVNIAGRERVRSYMVNPQTKESEMFDSDSKNVRMKEWQWSVNVRAGVSYPLVRFVSAFAEAGAVYYFANGSDMETIYSDKPFNVNPQLGIRFNF